MLVSGYFRLPKDIPKPVWRYPMSYISFHFWALQVKNNFINLIARNNKILKILKIGLTIIPGPIPE